MYNKIFFFLCKPKIINTNQLCFWSKHSIKHALIRLIETTKKYRDSSIRVERVFIKLEKSIWLCKS